MKNWMVLIVNALIPSLLFVPCAELKPTFTATPPNLFSVLEGNNITFVWQYNLDGTFDRVFFQFINGSSSITILIKAGLNSNIKVPNSFYEGRIQENINVTQAEITIFALQRSESGEYEFHVSDSTLDPAINKVTVQVQYSPEFNSISRDVAVVEDDHSITLECIADGEPTPNITWTKVYAHGSDSGVLGTGNQFVLETNRNNRGKYRCTAYNGIGTAPNRTVKVEVNYIPENVKLMVNDSVVCKGDVISITCSADGKPAVHTYQLFENGIPVNDGNSSAGVWIRKYLKGGDLSYRCVANNTVGSAEKTVNFTVKVPSIVYPLENITVIEGENRTLTCNVSGGPVLTVTWTEVRSRSQSSGVVRYLTNISRKNADEYKCEATNDCRNSSASTFLTVLYPPEFNNVSSNVVVVEGDPNITLQCIADGEPTPNITWTKIYANGSDSGLLATGNQFFLETNRNNSGTYRCTAFNGIGTVPNGTVKVEVNFKPENVKLMVNDSVICKSDVVSITCSAAGKPAVHIYQLFENEIPVNDGNSSAGVWIRKDLKGRDLSYSCVANNTVGTAEKTLNVTVKVPLSIQAMQDQNVTEGYNLTLKCIVSGIPSPTVSWIKLDGQRHHGHILEITYINRTQAGEYKCEASNECGNATETATIDVQYKPENVQLMSSAMNDKGCRGEVISFNCSAIANPGVTSYQLFENGTAIFNTSASGMWSKTLGSEGVFVYKCVANNSLGSEYSMSITITTNAPSSIIQVTQDQNVTEGDNVTLMCNVSGMPTPIVSWMTPYSQRVSGYKLEVRKINRSQAGEYKCEASNECDNATEMATIIVQYKPGNVQLTTSVMDNKACKGDMIGFTCSAEANPSVTSYQLFENGKVIVDANLSGMWKRNVLTGGLFMYKCVANNSLGSEVSSPVMITVNVPSNIESIQDQNVTEGDNLTLTCSATGVPQPKVSWIKPGGHRHNGHTLEVTHITRGQTGEYKCETSSECGNATEKATIHVLYTPRITNISGEQIVNKGDVVGLFCEVEGNPAPKITWIKVADNSQVNFPFTIRGSQDEGLYGCTAENGVGSPVTKFVNVTVHSPAAVMAMGEHTVVKGGTIVLHCNVSGTPPLSILWTHVKSGKTWNQKKWSIEDIQVEKLGEYRCNASNKYGGEIKSTFIFYEGGLCEKPCTAAKSCHKFGETYICICPLGKTGANCQETEELQKNFVMVLKLKGEFKQVYENLENPETKMLVRDIEENTMEEFKVTSLASVKVLELREGSVIAEISLTFDEPVGESEVESLLLDASNDGSLGNLKVESFSVGPTISDSATVPGPVPSEPAKVNKDVVYGSVIGVLALILALIIIFLAWKRYKREKDDRLDTGIKESREPYFNEGFELESSNGNLSTVVHHGPGHYMDLNEVRSLNEPTTDPARCYLEINEYAPLHPGTRSWEVERENVTIEKVIGKGAFGQVAQGKASNLRGREETMTVAIKMLKGNATDTERKDLLSELEVMKKLKPHPHVIRLLGCVTESDPLLVLIEYVPYGDLLGYLRKSRQLEDNYFKDLDIKPQTSLTSQQLMKFSWQVADGMHYLSSKNIIHRDLAARNVLVGERERCKVTDFGMARDVCQENIYERKSKGRLPVKWTACEALLYGRYTTKSDVWSFGIVLYEIFTIGGSPYPKIHGRKMADLLTQGYRMPKPRHVDDTLYKIMQDCWQETPDDRPMFENLRNDLKEMENQHQRLINMKHYDNILYTGMD